METPSNREPILDVSPEDVEQAIDIIRQTRLATVTCLQRRLRIGYVRAARIMDELELKGIIGPVRGTEPRQIFLATMNPERQTIKAILLAFLKANGYDGLCNPGAGCACLAGDLIPCGELSDSCEPGHKENVSADVHCDCDGEGTDHWHIVARRLDTLHDHLMDASNWLCECGQRCTPTEGDWRWNGTAWEHHHGYPIGHVPAKRVPLQEPDSTKSLEGRVIEIGDIESLENKPGIVIETTREQLQQHGRNLAFAEVIVTLRATEKVKEAV